MLYMTLRATKAYAILGDYVVKIANFWSDASSTKKC